MCACTSHIHPKTAPSTFVCRRHFVPLLYLTMFGCLFPVSPVGLVYFNAWLENLYPAICLYRFYVHLFFLFLEHSFTLPLEQVAPNKESVATSVALQRKCRLQLESVKKHEHGLSICTETSFLFTRFNPIVP